MRYGGERRTGPLLKPLILFRGERKLSTVSSALIELMASLSLRSCNLFLTFLLSSLSEELQRSITDAFLWRAMLRLEEATIFVGNVPRDVPRMYYLCLTQRSFDRALRLSSPNSGSYQISVPLSKSGIWYRSEARRNSIRYEPLGRSYSELLWQHSCFQEHRGALD